MRSPEFGDQEWRNLPKTKGKIGSSRGFSGKPKVTSFPFVFSRLRSGAKA